MPAAVAIVDTSIFCEILNIPGKNTRRTEILNQMEEFINNGTTFLLPMAAVYETGNHIAHLSNGEHRRLYAEKFVEQVTKAIAGEIPWQVMQVPTVEEIQDWLSGFPDAAMRGESMGDLSMIKEWENYRRKPPHHRVFIWSLDRHLQGYDSHQRGER